MPSHHPTRRFWSARFSRARVEDFLAQHGLLIVILVLGIVARTLFFGANPPGLNQDEAATAYDAYALLTTGMDRNGFPFPAVLVSWGSGMNALAAYAMIPFIALFGLSPFSIRMPNLFFGIGSLVVWYLFVRRIANKTTALIATFLLAVSPWHIIMSRWGLDENAFPFFFLLGAYFLSLSEARTPRHLALSALFFGLSLYAHGAAYFTVPAFCLLAGIAVLRAKTFRWNAVIPAAAILALLALPHVLYLLINHFELPSIVTPVFSVPRLSGIPRYETVSSLFSSNFFAALSVNIRALWDLLRFQNDGMIWSVMPAFGVLYLWSGPFMALGFLLVLSRSWPFKPLKEGMVLLWILVSALLGLLLSANVNRMNILFIPLTYLIAVAVASFQKQRLVMGALLCMYLISFARFTRAYIREYPAMIGPAFFESFGDALQVANKARGEICVTDQVNMPYIFALVYNRVDAREFTNTVQYANPGAEFQVARSFGRYFFGMQHCPAMPGAYVLTHGEADRIDLQDYAVTRFLHYTAAVR